ncbi:hypothetical protein MMC27_003547 [Xylographa pallens]|nr:hypothetical protein [Xylographa pallens]
MSPQVRKRTRASKVSASSRNVSEESSFSQVPQTPISEWILHPDAEQILRIIRDKYGEPVSILPVDEEELFCVCLSVESKYPGGMVECTNASKCLARWFHFRCIGMTVAPGEDDDWFCTRCIQRRIGRAGDWFDGLPYTLRGKLQNSILGQPSTTSAGLSNAVSNNPFVYRIGITAPLVISHKTAPMSVSLPIRGIRGNSGLPHKGFPDCEDLVMCDVNHSAGNTTISEETEVLKNSKVIQEQMGGVRLVEPGTDRTPVVRRERNTTKQHRNFKMRTTDDSMDSTESVSEIEYGNDYSACNDPIELCEDVSDGYLGEESDVSMSGDS